MSSPLHLFEGFGIELEYMIVAREDLRVRPITDELIRQVSGRYESDVERGPLTWSNELVLHVVELKTTAPATSLTGWASRFQAGVREVNAVLAGLGAQLLPSAMHPWMDPDTETRLWPHDYNAVYEAFDRVFNCRGHGWANLQSVHLNLPFAGDDEFGRLHAAIRLVLPILPALAASSPIADGRPTGLLDTRLEYYRHNSRRVPSVAGRIIPEPVFTKRDYREQILARMYRDIAPHDPAGTLQDEWLNARGTIARFARDTFEIRVLDVQECPAADLAIAALLTAVLRGLVQERWCSREEQQRWDVPPLEDILLRTIRAADQAPIEDAAYLRLFGVPRAPCSAGELWRHLSELAWPDGPPAEFQPALQTLLDRGPLARRILQALPAEPDRAALAQVYRELGRCLADGRMFLPPPA